MAKTEAVLQFDFSRVYTVEQYINFGKDAEVENDGRDSRIIPHRPFHYAVALSALSDLDDAEHKMVAAAAWWERGSIAAARRAEEWRAKGAVAIAERWRNGAPSGGLARPRSTPGPRRYRRPFAVLGARPGKSAQNRPSLGAYGVSRRDELTPLHAQPNDMPRALAAAACAHLHFIYHKTRSSQSLGERLARMRRPNRQHATRP